MAGYLGMLASMPGNQKIMDGGGAGPSVFRIAPGLFWKKSNPQVGVFARGAGWLGMGEGEGGKGIDTVSISIQYRY